MVQEARVIVVLKKMNDQERHILQNLRPDQVCIDLTGTIKSWVSSNLKCGNLAPLPPKSSCCEVGRYLVS